MSDTPRYAVASKRDGEHVVKTTTRKVAEAELERLEAEQREDYLARKRHAHEPGAIIPHPGYELVELPVPGEEPGA